MLISLITDQRVSAHHCSYHSAQYCMTCLLYDPIGENSGDTNNFAHNFTCALCLCYRCACLYQYNIHVYMYTGDMQIV